MAAAIAPQLEQAYFFNGDTTMGAQGSRKFGGVFVYDWKK